jgi:hypothetical protein
MKNKSPKRSETSSSISKYIGNPCSSKHSSSNNLSTFKNSSKNAVSHFHPSRSKTQAKIPNLNLKLEDSYTDDY